MAEGARQCQLRAKYKASRMKNEKRWKHCIARHMMRTLAQDVRCDPCSIPARQGPSQRTAWDHPQHYISPRQLFRQYASFLDKSATTLGSVFRRAGRKEGIAGYITLPASSSRGLIVATESVNTLLRFNSGIYPLNTQTHIYNIQPWVTHINCILET